MCLLHFNSVRYFRARGRYTHVSHEFDVALCCVTLETAALSLSLVGHSSSMALANKHENVKPLELFALELNICNLTYHLNHKSQNIS